MHAQIDSAKRDYSNIELMRTTEKTGIGLIWPHISGIKRTGGLGFKRLNIALSRNVNSRLQGG